MLFYVFDNSRPAIALPQSSIADTIRGAGHVIEATDDGAGGFVLQHKRIVGVSHTTVDDALRVLESTLRHRLMSAKARRKANAARKARDARNAPPSAVSSYEWRPYHREEHAL